jgi:hypothetical protein
MLSVLLVVDWLCFSEALTLPERRSEHVTVCVIICVVLLLEQCASFRSLNDMEGLFDLA